MNTNARDTEHPCNAEAKILGFPRSGHTDLRFINRQLKLSGQEATYALHYSVPRSFTSDIDYAVVCVSSEVQPALFKLFIQLVQHDIRQQR